MKKFVSLLLAAIMLLSLVVIPVSADEPEYAAPTVYGAQEKDNETDNTKLDIRFLAIATSLVGAKFGFEIKGTYYDATSGKYVTKTLAGTENDKLETDTVYTSIFGKSASYTAAALGAEIGISAENAKGIFAVGITGVPKNIDIVFEVQTYVKNLAGDIVARSEWKKGAYDQGEVADIKFYQNFDAVKGTSGDYLAFRALMNNATDVTGSLTYTVSEDGALTFTVPAGNLAVYNILPANTITSANYDKYIFEMEITIGTDWNPNNAGYTTLMEFGPLNTMNWSGRQNSLRLRANGAANIAASIADSAFGNVATGAKHRYKMVYDYKANTATAYLDGVEARSITLTPASMTGGFMMYLNHNANSGSATYSVTLDNIVFKGIPKA